MKTTLCSATVVAVLCFVGFATQTMRAQSSRVQSAGTNVAVIDIARIIREYPPLQKAASETKRSVAALRKWTEDQKLKIRHEQMKLPDFKPNSLEYKQLEERLAKMAIDLKLEAARRQREILEHESNAYYDFCMRLREAVSRLAERERIGLVLRYNSSEIDPTVFRSVQDGILRQVVYQNGLDITPMIQQHLVQTNTVRRPDRTGPPGPVRQR